MAKKAKIYTRTGDTGWTSVGIERVPKNDPRIMIFGLMDELNVRLGMASLFVPKKMKSELEEIQDYILSFGSLLCTNLKEEPDTTSVATRRLEKLIDDYNEQLPPIYDFVRIGTNIPSCHIHLARVTCRNLERELCGYLGNAKPNMMAFINRLSDLLFTMARIVAGE